MHTLELDQRRFKNRFQIYIRWERLWTEHAYDKPHILHIKNCLFLISELQNNHLNAANRQQLKGGNLTVDHQRNGGDMEELWIYLIKSLTVDYSH